MEKTGEEALVVEERPLLARDIKLREPQTELVTDILSENKTRKHITTGSRVKLFKFNVAFLRGFSYLGH